jgi:hypothetical protein
MRPVVIAILLAWNAQAQANYQATCSYRDTNNQPICSSVACGESPLKARQACLRDCPSGEIDSVGTSNCKIPGVPTPDDGAFNICAYPPPAPDRLEYGPSRTIPALGEHYLYWSLPAPPPGKTTNVYCKIQNVTGEGWCRKDIGGRCYTTVYAQNEMKGFGTATKAADGTYAIMQAFVNKDKHTPMTYTLAVEKPDAKGIIGMPPLVAAGVLGGALAIAGGLFWRRRQRR